MSPKVLAFKRAHGLPVTRTGSLARTGDCVQCGRPTLAHFSKRNRFISCAQRSFQSLPTPLKQPQRGAHVPRRPRQSRLVHARHQAQG